MKICEAGRDSCGCNNWTKGIRTINGQYPDDNREFKVNAGAGILITPATAGITITNSSDPGALEAGDNIVLTPNGDHLIIALAQNIAIGNLDVAGDIIQHGAAYETHMEKVYTVNDYIIMRDGAVSGLQSGEYSGFQVKKYDGTNDGRLVIDNTGTARVGDVGDEQPLLTRAESGSLTNGQSLVWDAANAKAITQSIPSDISTALAGKQDKLTLSKNSHTITIPPAHFSDTTLSMTLDPGTYIINVGMSYTVGANGDTACVCGFSDGGTDEWLQNNYPSIINDVNRINASYMQTYYVSTTIYPIFYRISTDTVSGITWMDVLRIA